MRLIYWSWIEYKDILGSYRLLSYKIEGLVGLRVGLVYIGLL